MSDYDRIAQAIEFIVTNAERQPGLAEVAAHTNLSPFHFQRLFSRWAGVTPKRLLQVVTVERAKQLLTVGRQSLLETSEILGLSSSSRLQDHFVKLQAMTPDEFRQSGQGLRIRTGKAASPFGPMFIAWTERGICALSFIEQAGSAEPLERLVSDWPDARLVPDDRQARRLIESVFDRPVRADEPISLAVKGTNFQVAVWRALLRIPPGALVAYGDVAAAVGRPKAVRAVGTAVGANPCAFVIPCHRVIRESGELGGYRWGLTRKQAINVWEAASVDGMLS